MLERAVSESHGPSSIVGEVARTGPSGSPCDTGRVSRTWIVIPLFNEAPVIGSVVSDLLESFSNIVCVDDGSTDGSAAVARQAGAVVVQHPVNLGQGAALQTGFEYALQDPDMSSIVTFDADGQHRVSDARAMVRRLESGEADVVLGSRFLDGRTKIGPVKRLVLRTAALQTRLSTGLPLTDAHNGLRAFNRNVVAHLHLTQNRMAHASELIQVIVALKPRWTEHPVEIIYTDYSKAKGQSLLNSVNILADLLFR
ncbi:glycosyltransferase [Vibrio cholerae]|nr:glycosyltransferase [Vibrio cholerae]